jgi:EamA domain-containing membrane protein RarD
MSWMRSRVAWVAALISLFALLRALRRLVELDERPAALVVALFVVVTAAFMPTRLGRGQVPAEQAGWRKALQFLAAGAVTVLAAFLGGGVVPAGVLGVVAASTVPLAWPAPVKAI